MKNPEYLKTYENKEKKTETHEQEINNHMVAGLNKLVKPNEKYATFKYEDPKNKDNKYNVGVQKLREGFSVLLMDPAKPEMVLKGIFKPNKKPDFSQIVTEKKEGVTKKESEKKMPSNPQVMKNFMAIVENVNKIEVEKKQAE